MPKLTDIISATDDFFSMHWDKLTDKRPYVWLNNWSWNTSVPHHDKPGVYALLDASGEVLYIGIGASRGGGKYKEHGISRRLLAHVITTDKEKGMGTYKPKNNWNDVVDIAAIGFPSEYSYLALALEDYLIGLFNPVRNRVKKARTSS